MKNRHELFERAKERCKRAEDGTFDKDELIENLTDEVQKENPAEDMWRRLAASIWEDETKPRARAGDDHQLMLPGLGELFDPDSQRPVLGVNNRVIEECHATWAHLMAEEERAEENHRRVTAALTATRLKNRQFGKWTTSEAIRGRPAADLTWRNFLLEVGVKPEAPMTTPALEDA